MSSKKMPLLCLLWILLVLPAAEAKQSKESEEKERPAGTIQIVTDIPNLKVFINGEPEGLAHPDRPLRRDYIPAGEVMVSVSAKNYPERKQSVRLEPGETEELSFRFAPPSPEIRLKPGEGISEPENAADSVRPVSELLRIGDRCFRLQRYMYPEHENAFEMYKSVLAAEPQNVQAWIKIHEMTGIYKKMAADNEDKNLERALSCHKNCLKLLAFAVESMKDTGRMPEYETLKKRVTEMEADIRKADELVKEGDIHFIAQRYTTPKEKNAFSLYKSALKKNPTHEYAKKRILEIAQFYREWADKARRDRNRAKAEKYQRQYLPISQYISEHFGDREAKSKKENSRRHADLSRKTEKLLKQGAEYIRRAQYAGAGEKNALRTYQQILRLDPQNSTALEKIRELMKICQEKGRAASEKGEYREAESWFDQYLQTAGYAAETGKISLPKTEIAQILRQRADMEHRVRGLEMEAMRDTLKKNYDLYRELRTKEESGINVGGQIMPVMREIISNLNRIEQLYEEQPAKEGDIAEKTDRVRELRMEMEKEMEIRQGRAH